MRCDCGLVDVSRVTPPSDPSGSIVSLVLLAVRARVGALVLVLLVGSSACSSDNNDTKSSVNESSTGQRSSSAASPTSDAPEAARLRITIADPGLVVTLPDGWHRESLRQAKAQVIGAAREAPPAFRRVLLRLLHSLRSGIIVAEATGPIDAQNYSPQLSVSVETDDASVTSAATRRLRSLLQNSIPGVPRKIVDRRAITLPVGRAVRVITRTPPPPGTNGVPSQSVEYVLLIEGSTISIGGTAPTADRDFVAIIDAIANAVTRA